MPSGTSVDLHLTVPIKEWDTATLHITWTTAPLRRPFSRGTTSIRLADALARPQVTWSSRGVSPGVTVTRSAPTIVEALRLRSLENTDRA